MGLLSRRAVVLEDGVLLHLASLSAEVGEDIATLSTEGEG
jgi:hypothetical protein